MTTASKQRETTSKQATAFDAREEAAYTFGVQAYLWGIPFLEAPSGEGQADRPREIGKEKPLDLGRAAFRAVIPHPGRP